MRDLIFGSHIRLLIGSRRHLSVQRLHGSPQRTKCSFRHFRMGASCSSVIGVNRKLPGIRSAMAKDQTDPAAGLGRRAAAPSTSWWLLFLSMGNVGFNGERWFQWGTLVSMGNVGFNGERWFRWGTSLSMENVGFNGECWFRWGTSLSMGNVGFNGERWFRWGTLVSMGNVGFDGECWYLCQDLGIFSYLSPCCCVISLQYRKHTVGFPFGRCEFFLWYFNK